MRVPYRNITSKRELAEATVAFNCGISPDYDVPPDWEPSDEAWAQAQTLAAGPGIDSRAADGEERI